jgi:ABC-2 type transport system permease protein
MSTTITPHAVTETPLVPTAPRGWLGGFGNLLRKELGQWFGTRVWWVHTAVWLVVLNGIVAIAGLDPELAAEELVRQSVQAFLTLATTAVAIGAVVTVQGSVVGEKDLGTAAWVISKPVARASFIVAKLVAHTTGFLVTAILVPTAVFAVEAAVLLPQSLDYGPLLASLTLVVLSLVFYVALTLALGTLFAGRGPVAGIGIGLILTGTFLDGILPEALVLATPWRLGDVAGSLALDLPIGFDWYLPVVATAAFTVVFVAVAVWRFGREEF